MASNVKPALCGKCNIALKGPADPKPESVFVCPVCGESDTLENVTRIIGEYAEEVTARFFDEKARRMARDIPMLKVTSNPIPERDHRFIVDLELPHS